MPKPCKHETHDHSCPVCKVYSERKDYRLMWDGRPMEEVWAASAEIARKSGGRPVFSQPTVHQPIANAVAAAIKSSRGKCVHLGVVIPNKVSGSCRTTHECELVHGAVRPCVECKTCEDFAPEDDDSSDAV